MLNPLKSIRWTRALVMCSFFAGMIIAMAAPDLMTMPGPKPPPPLP